MADAPHLRLDLHPVVPDRRRSDSEWLGYELRVPDGPLVHDDDALLAAYGAFVATAFLREEDDESLQHEAFAPGRELALSDELLDPDDPELVTIWSADRVLRGGELDLPRACQVLAALEHGLELRAVALAEQRTTVDDLREGLTLVVWPAAFVTVGPPPMRLAPPRGRHAPRRRVVLVATEDGGLRWWDAAVAGGPLDLDELPLTQSVRDRFADVGRSLREHADEREAGDDARGLERLEDWLEADALRDEVEGLWHHARRVLGLRYVAGYRLPGERTIRWEPTDEDPSREDIPF